MAAKRKCVCCGEWIETDEVSIPYKKRYAHERCFNTSLKVLHKEKKKELEKKEEDKNKKSKKAKTKAELKDAMSEEEYQEKTLYLNYLKKLLQEDLPAKVYAITNDYIKRYDFTYKGMYDTLVYLNEILEKELTGDIVGLIPYYYTEAIGYYEKIKQVEEINKDKDISKMYQTHTVFINTKPRRNKKIDINSIGNEESK